MTNPLYSIVVPVKNGINTLPRLIEGIRKQTLFNKTEIVVIDSGSSDNSVEYLSIYPFVKLISIDPKSFNHGATRNQAVQHCSGEFILMTVQDAWAEDTALLEKMSSHFSDEQVMGVCGQQIVPHEKSNNPLQWFRPQSKSSVKRVYFKSREDFERLTPKEQRETCGWDDVVAMYRKSALVELPFEPLIFGEDMLWAKNALLKGWTLVYDTSCRVNHYHFEHKNYTGKRVLISKLFTYKCFGYFDDRKFDAGKYFSAIYQIVKNRQNVKWILHNWKLYTNYNKATKSVEKHIHNDSLDTLENELSISIPIGSKHMQ